MTKAEAFKKLEMTVGGYLLSGHADDSTCGEWREILETLKQDQAADLCEDAVSRKETLDMVQRYQERLKSYIGTPDDSMENACERGLLLSIQRGIKRLPPITPTREHGEWRETGETILTFMGTLLFECQCSKCKGLAFFRKESLEHKLVGADFCPCCGADMRKEQK